MSFLLLRQVIFFVPFSGNHRIECCQCCWTRCYANIGARAQFYSGLSSKWQRLLFKFNSNRTQTNRREFLLSRWEWTIVFFRATIVFSWSFVVGEMKLTPPHTNVVCLIETFSVVERVFDQCTELCYSIRWNRCLSFVLASCQWAMGHRGHSR